MKIYAILHNNDQKYANGELTEWVYFEHDLVLEGYKHQEGDIIEGEYLCKVHWGEYMRVQVLRLLLCLVKEVDSLESFMKNNPDTTVCFHRGQFCMDVDFC